MPTRSSKGGKSAASNKDRTTHGGGGRPTSPRPSQPSSPSPLADSDPPIVIQGGGSVTIYSQFRFELLIPNPGDKYPYAYYSKEASIGKMEMHGKGGGKGDESDAGKFKIDLYKRSVQRRK
jgi:hypothetical protein